MCTTEHLQPLHALNHALPYLLNQADQAKAHRKEIRGWLLEAAGYKSPEEFLHAVAPQTCVVMLCAGASERFRNAARENPSLGIDPDAPKALAPVPNYITCFGDGPAIPIVSYAFQSLAPLGTMFVVGRASEQGGKILKVAQQYVSNPILFEQELCDGYEKPRGHLDALAQLQEDKRICSTYKYIITAFGTEFFSRGDIADTLLTMVALNKNALTTSVVIPTAYMDNPPYPLLLDSSGHITNMTHNRVAQLAPSQRIERGFSNIGPRVYNADMLGPVLAELNVGLSQDSRLIRIGKQVIETPAELPVDLFDQRAADIKQAFQLAICETALFVKKPEDLPAYIAHLREHPRAFRTL